MSWLETSTRMWWGDGALTLPPLLKFVSRISNGNTYIVYKQPYTMYECLRNSCYGDFFYKSSKGCSAQ